MITVLDFISETDGERFLAPWHHARNADVKGWAAGRSLLHYRSMPDQCPGKLSCVITDMEGLSLNIHEGVPTLGGGSGLH